MESTKLKKTDVAEVLKESKAAIAEAEKFLADNGVIYNLTDWLTIKRYCQRFGIENTETVSNWIRRGIIPPENVILVKELNDLKLIKAVPYL